MSFPLFADEKPINSLYLDLLLPRLERKVMQDLITFRQEA